MNMYRKFLFALAFAGVACGLLFTQQANAAISFVGCEHQSAGSENITVSVHASTLDDDVLIAFGQWGDDDHAPITGTGPSAFTEIDENAETAGSDNATWIGYKVASSEPASYTFNGSGAGSENSMAMICVFRGVDTTTPLDVTYSTASHYDWLVDDENPNTKSISTSSANAWIVLAANFRIQISSPAASGPSGFTDRSTFDETFARNGIITTMEQATPGTVSPGDFTVPGATSSMDSSNYILALKPAVAGLAFSSGPTVAAATQGYTISGTLTNTNATVYGWADVPTFTNPADCDALQALSGTASIFGSEGWAVDVADSFDITGVGEVVRHDVCVCADDGGANETAVTCFANEDRLSDAGQNIVELTSVASTSPFAPQSESTCDTTDTSPTLTGCADTSWLQPGMVVDLSAGFADLTDVIVEGVTADTITLENDANATVSNITVDADEYFSPDIAAGDIVEIDETLSSGETVTLAVDGDLSWSNETGLSMVTVDYCVQDISTGGALATPNCWSSDDTLTFFNTRPDLDLSDLAEDFILVLTQNTAMTTIDLKDYCLDTDLHSLSFSVRSGTVPAGTTIASNGVWSGTPTTEDEAGTVLNIACTDLGGLVEAENLTVYVENQDVMPDITGDTVTAAYATIIAAVPALEDNLSITVTFKCSNTVASGDIISQSPLAGAGVAVGDPILADVSTGGTCVTRRRN